MIGKFLLLTVCLYFLVFIILIFMDKRVISLSLFKMKNLNWHDNVDCISQFEEIEVQRKLAEKKKKRKYEPQHENEGSQSNVGTVTREKEREQQDESYDPVEAPVFNEMILQSIINEEIPHDFDIETDSLICTQAQEEYQNQMEEEYIDEFAYNYLNNC